MKYAATRKDDEELIREVQKGQLAAYATLVQRYERFVFGVAYHFLRDVEDARDASQDAWIRAYTRLNQLREPAKFGSWLRHIAVNEARAHLGRRRREGPIAAADGIEKAQGLEERLVVEAALDSLDEKSRLTTVLFYLHAYSLSEIAGFLAEPETTIKSRLRNARAKMRRHLEVSLEIELGPGALPDDFAQRVTALISAARLGDANELARLLEADPRLLSASMDPSGMTALHVAAAAGHAPLVEFLLAEGADPNCLDNGDNASPLHYAAERGRLEVVTLLVAAGADVNWNRDVHERGPLGWATVFGLQMEVAKFLLDHGAKHDVFSATAMGDKVAVKKLVEEDPICVNARRSECDHRLSVVTFAAGAGQAPIGRFLVERGAKVGLSEAAGLRMLPELRRLLDSRQDQEELDRALVTAVKGSQPEAARMLVAAGANPNAAPYGCSPIFDTIADHNREMSKLLIELGADLEWNGNYWKSSALGYRVFFGDAEGVALALSLGAEIGETLVDLAKAGERGELRQHSAGTPEGYHQVVELLQSALAG